MFFARKAVWLALMFPTLRIVWKRNHHATGCTCQTTECVDEYSDHSCHVLIIQLEKKEQKAASWATQAKEAASTAQMEGGRAEALMKQANKAAEEKREEEKAAERARIEAEEKARIEAEQAAERARIEAEEKARIEAEKAAERARIEAEEKGRIEAEQAAEQARIEAEEKARIEAEKAAERARIEAEEKARTEAEQKAVEAARIQAEAQSVMNSMKSETSTVDLQGTNGVEDQPKEQAPEALATNPSLPKTGPTSPCKQQKAAQDPTLTSQAGPR